MGGMNTMSLTRGKLLTAIAAAAFALVVTLGFAAPAQAVAADNATGLAAGSAQVAVQDDQEITMRNPEWVSLWAGDTTNWSLMNFLDNADFNLTVTKATSSNSKVLKVIKRTSGQSLSNYTVQSPGAGKATLTVTYTQNGTTKTISETYTVKKFSDGISSITFNGAKMTIPTSKAAINADQCFQFKGTSAKLVVETKNGWEVTGIHGYFNKKNSSTSQEFEITNGKSFSIKKGYQGSISINFRNSSTGEYFWYNLGVYRDKPFELAAKATYFVGYPKKRSPIISSLYANTDDLTILSVASSNSSVLKVAKKGKKFDKVMLQAKKAGTSKLTIKYKYKGKTYTTVSKCTVPATYPLKSVKVNGKSLKLKKSPYGQSYAKYNKDTATIKVTAAKGWKLKGLKFYGDMTTGKAVKIKNGAKVDIPKGNYSYAVATLKKGKTTFSYSVYFDRA